MKNFTYYCQAKNRGQLCYAGTIKAATLQEAYNRLLLCLSITGNRYTSLCVEQANL